MSHMLTTVLVIHAGVNKMLLPADTPGGRRRLTGTPSPLHHTDYTTCGIPCVDLPFALVMQAGFTLALRSQNVGDLFTGWRRLL